MAAQQIDQISVQFAVRIKTLPDYEGLVVTREYYRGFSCDGLVVSGEVRDKEGEKFEHRLWLSRLLSVSDSGSREAENIARIQKESNKEKCGRLYSCCHCEENILLCALSIYSLKFDSGL
jgi:hypothetical protein